MHSGGRGGGDVSTKESERHDIYASRPNRNHMGNKVRKQSQWHHDVYGSCVNMHLKVRCFRPTASTVMSGACIACILMHLPGLHAYAQPDGHHRAGHLSI